MITLYDERRFEIIFDKMGSRLKKICSWINEELQPEDVFDKEKLIKWGYRSGFIKDKKEGK